MKIKVLLIVAIAIILIIVLKYTKSHIKLNLPLEELSYDNSAFENNYNNLIDVLNQKNIIDGYELSCVSYNKSEKCGDVMFSSISDYSIIWVNIIDDCFEAARIYNTNSRFANIMYNPPMDMQDLNICSQDLFNIIKNFDDEFDVDSILFLELGYNSYYESQVWECIYKTNNSRNIKVNATNGEILYNASE